MHGFVAGSEITTAGLQRAFRRRNAAVSRATGGDGDEGVVKVFAPFSYAGLTTSVTHWDLAVVEGWTGPVPRFIASVRRHSPGCVVLYWCLDTQVVDERTLARVDVNGFMTNSELLAQRLRRGIVPASHEPSGSGRGVLADAVSAPSNPAGMHPASVPTAPLIPVILVHLAVDADVMRPVPPVPHYAHNVTYLGQMSLSKWNLTRLLSTAQHSHGLALYGVGWDRFEHELRPSHRGVLPKDDIAALYSSSRVVLGTTEHRQRELGMVNNRVFEAIACGAAFVSDHFPAMERLLGNGPYIRYIYPDKQVSGDGDDGPVAEQLRAHLTALMGESEAETAARVAAGRAFVKAHHSYDARAHQILELFEGLHHSVAVRQREEGQEGEAKEQLPATMTAASLARRVLAGPRRPRVLFLHGPDDTSCGGEDDQGGWADEEAGDWRLRLGLLPALSLLGGGDMGPGVGAYYRVTVRSTAQLLLHSRNSTNSSGGTSGGGAGALGRAVHAACATEHFDLVLVHAARGSELARAASYRGLPYGLPASGGSAEAKEAAQWGTQSGSGEAEGAAAGGGGAENEEENTPSWSSAGREKTRCSAARVLLVRPDAQGDAAGTGECSGVGSRGGACAADGAAATLPNALPPVPPWDFEVVPSALDAAAADDIGIATMVGLDEQWATEAAGVAAAVAAAAAARSNASGAADAGSGDEDAEDWCMGGVGRVPGAAAATRWDWVFVGSLARAQRAARALCQLGGKRLAVASGGGGDRAKAMVYARRLSACGVRLMHPRALRGASRGGATDAHDVNVLARLLSPACAANVLVPTAAGGGGEEVALAALAAGQAASAVKVATDNAALGAFVNAASAALQQHRLLPAAVLGHSALASRLQRVLDAALHQLDKPGSGDAADLSANRAVAMPAAAGPGVRAAAAIAIVTPRHGSAVSGVRDGDSGVRRLEVTVALRGFSLPADGMWCLRLDDEEQACVGDPILRASLPLPSAAELQRRGGVPLVMRLRAVLRAGLEDAVVVRTSQEVVVTVAVEEEEEQQQQQQQQQQQDEAGDAGVMRAFQAASAALLTLAGTPEQALAAAMAGERDTILRLGTSAAAAVLNGGGIGGAGGDGMVRLLLGQRRAAAHERAAELLHGAAMGKHGPAKIRLHCRFLLAEGAADTEGAGGKQQDGRWWSDAALELAGGGVTETAAAALRCAAPPVLREQLGSVALVLGSTPATAAAASPSGSLELATHAVPLLLLPMPPPIHLPSGVRQLQLGCLRLDLRDSAGGALTTLALEDEVRCGVIQRFYGYSTTALPVSSAVARQWAWRVGAPALVALPSASFDRVIVAHALAVVETGNFGMHGHAALLREAARLLRPGGSLLLLELDQHDSIELRETILAAVAKEAAAAAAVAAKGSGITSNAGDAGAAGTATARQQRGGWRQRLGPLEPGFVTPRHATALLERAGLRSVQRLALSDIAAAVGAPPAGEAGGVNYAEALGTALRDRSAFVLQGVKP